MQKLKESKEKEKLSDSRKKVTRSYSTKGSEMKLIVYAIKKNKSSTAKIRRLGESTAKANEKLNIIEVRIYEDEYDIVIGSKKKRLDAHQDKRTRSSNPKYGSHGISRKKHIFVKRKKVSKGLGPIKTKEEEKNYVVNLREQEKRKKRKLSLEKQLML